MFDLNIGQIGMPNSRVSSVLVSDFRCFGWHKGCGYEKKGQAPHDLALKTVILSVDSAF